MRNAILLGAVLAGFFLSGTVAARANEVSKMIDIDGDGYKEAVVFYSESQIVKTLVDFDHDKYMETIIYYKNGYRDRAEQDLNRDGRVDHWVSYYFFTGLPWKTAEDLNGDGKPDYWAYWKDGKIYRWEQDRDGDGKADVKTVYGLDAAQKRVLLQQSYDNDADGVFESLSGSTVVRQEATLPHSLAEALLR